MNKLIIAVVVIIWGVVVVGTYSAIILIATHFLGKFW